MQDLRPKGTSRVGRRRGSHGPCGRVLDASTLPDVAEIYARGPQHGRRRFRLGGDATRPPWTVDARADGRGAEVRERESPGRSGIVGAEGGPCCACGTRDRASSPGRTFFCLAESFRDESFLPDLPQETVGLCLLGLLAGVYGREVRAASYLRGGGPATAGEDADVQLLAVRGYLVDVVPEERAVDACDVEVAFPAVDRVVGLQVEGVDEVVALLAEEVVLPRAALNAVALGATRDVVVARVAEEPVRAVFAEDLVGAAVVGDVVPAVRPDEAIAGGVTADVVRPRKSRLRSTAPASPPPRKPQSSVSCAQPPSPLGTISGVPTTPA